VLFERFLSKERNAPPDIDVDFEHQRREEVSQYIYARYGLERAALAATVICYRLRSAPRDTGRQRPGTASGTTFVTLEDETGSVNVIVWSHVGERQRRELLSARLMGVKGWLERESSVMHLIATRLSDHTPLLGRLATRSRDFH
jgi:error-prone DNA polymerase